MLALDHGEILSLGHTNTGVVKAFREVGFQYQRGGCVIASVFYRDCYCSIQYVLYLGSISHSNLVHAIILPSFAGGSMSPKFLVIDLQDGFVCVRGNGLVLI